MTKHEALQILEAYTWAERSRNPLNRPEPVEVAKALAVIQGVLQGATNEKA
jgi:hypothetical protein